MKPTCYAYSVILTVIEIIKEDGLKGTQCYAVYVFVFLICDKKVKVK
jgi:hypothetical protein